MLFYCLLQFYSVSLPFIFQLSHRLWRQIQFYLHLVCDTKIIMCLNWRLKRVGMGLDGFDRTQTRIFLPDAGSPIPLDWGDGDEPTLTLCVCHFFHQLSRRARGQRHWRATPGHRKGWAVVERPRGTGEGSGQVSNRLGAATGRKRGPQASGSHQGIKSRCTRHGVDCDHPNLFPFWIQLAPTWIHQDE